MELVKLLNLGLRFALELCLLIALAYSGFHITDNPVFKWILLFALPTSAAMVWGLLIAPKASHRLGQPTRLVVELVLFGLAIVLLYFTDRKMAATTFAIVVLVNELLILTWKQ